MRRVINHLATHWSRFLRSTGIMLVGFLCVFLNSPVPDPTYAAVGINQQINFQGKLVNPNGTNVGNGNYSIVFTLYDAAGGGTNLWDETQTVAVNDGIFQVALGSVDTTLGAVDFNSDQIYLGIKVGADAEMTPRIRFTAVPYALNSGKLSGLTSSQFVQLAQGVQTDSSTASSIFINKTGATGNILQLQDAGTDTFVVGNAGNTSINTNSTTALLVQNGNNAFGVDTTNIKVAIGLATTSATSRLSIAGQGSTNGITLGDGATGSANLYVSANDVLKTDDSLEVVGSITTTGNVVVGTGATSNSTLQIIGNTSFPTPTGEGHLFYHQTNNQMYVYDGTRWQGDRTTATKIVAASDSQNKEKADYVADGSDDEVEINAAISALPATGGIVYLLEGTYTIDDSVDPDDRGIEIDKSNVTLTGSGASTVIKLKNSITGATIDAIADNSAGAISRVTISNLKLDGNKTNNASGTQRGIFLSTVGSGSGSTATPGARIQNVWVEQFRSNGIEFNASPNGSISSSTILANGTTTADRAIYLGSSSSYNTVSANTVQGNTGNGILMNSSSTVNTISSNIIEGNGASGIVVATNGNTVLSNNLSANVDDAISISIASNNTISNNTIFGVSGATNSADGISISTGDANLISGNRIVNIGSTSGTSTGSSINLSAADSNSIVGNTITDSFGTGYAINISANSDTNYLATNTYSGTGAASINDLNATTIHAGQLNSSNQFVVQGTAGVVFAEDLALNGGDLTSSAATFNIISNTTATNVIMGTALTTGTIAIGGTTQTGTLTVGQSTASNTINIGNATIATGNTGTINIGTSATGTGKTVTTIGSTNDASSVTIQAGTGNINLNANTMANGDITSTGSVIAPTHTGTGAVTVSSGGSSALTLTSASGTAILGGSTNTIQRENSSLTFDILNAAAASTFVVVNSSATHVANLDVEGGVNIGSGQTYKINGTQISSANLSNDSNLAKLDATQTFTGNNTFGGTGSGAKIQIAGNYSDTSGTIINTLIQPNFNPTATSTATFVAASISPTINFANATPGAGNVTAFLVNPTWTAAPTGTLKLLDLQNGGTSVLNVSRTGIVTVNSPNTTNNAFLIQNQSGTALFNADTNSFKIRVGNGTPLLAASTTGGLFVTDSFEVLGLTRVGNATDNVTFDGTTKKVTYNGTARQTRKTTLSPEYLGAVMSGDGTNNIGTMSSDFCSGSGRLNVNPSICASTDEHNYYSWTAQATNDYDIYIRYQLPNDFDGFASNTSIQMYGWRSTSTEKIELALFNAGGTQCGTTTEVNSSNTTWQQTAMTGSETSDSACNTTNMAPGSTILFRVRMTVGTNNNFARAGAINFDYLSKF